MSTRTYLFARVWSGFPADFPAAAFDAIEDDALLEVLQSLAAQLFVGGKPIPPEDPLHEWVRRGLDSPPSCTPAFSEETRVKVGSAIFVAMRADWRNPIPRWTVFHAEDASANARHIISALPARVRVACPARFRVVEQGALAPADWLLLERELEQFDSVPRRLISVDEILGWRIHPLKRLQQEALALSRILRATPPSSTTGHEAERLPRSAEDASPAGAGGGYFSVADLAVRHGVNAEALRKRLDRWRVKALDGSFIENTEAKSKDPTYIYSESAVQPVITALRQASDTASGNRPAS